MPASPATTSLLNGKNMPTANAILDLADMATHLAQYDTDSLGLALKVNGVVQLHDFLPSTLLSELNQQADDLLDSFGRRIDVQVRSTGNTPRRYVSVGRNDVFKNSSLIKKLYFDRDVILFFEKLAQSAVIVAPYEPEQAVVNRMNQEGDTHGWHWDDYSYSVVLVLTAPQRENGAQVECVDRTCWDKDAARVEDYLRKKPVRSLALDSGSAYVLLGKRVMHRVSPMLRADTRKIICFTYAAESERFNSVDHGSMQDIYG